MIVCFRCSTIWDITLMVYTCITLKLIHLKYIEIWLLKMIVDQVIKVKRVVRVYQDILVNLRRNSLEVRVKRNYKDLWGKKWIIKVIWRLTYIHPLDLWSFRDRRIRYQWSLSQRSLNLSQSWIRVNKLIIWIIWHVQVMNLWKQLDLHWNSIHLNQWKVQEIWKEFST